VAWRGVAWRGVVSFSGKLGFIYYSKELVLSVSIFTDIAGTLPDKKGE
jgi:hypothetical protein